MTTDKNNPGAGPASGNNSAAPGAQSVPGSALLEQVAQKDHTGGNAVADPALLSQPLGEAVIQPRPANKEEDIFSADIKKQREKAQEQKKGDPSGGRAGGPGPAGKREPEPFTNPGMKDMNTEQKRTAAGNLAKMLLHGYDRLHKLADAKLQISPRKLLKIRLAGKIDLQTVIPVNANTSVSFEEFIQIYNEQVKGTIAMDPEWREEVEPVLVEVLSKYGHGLSPEQQLISMVIMEGLQQGQMFIAQTQTLNAIMAFGLEMTKMNRENGTASAQPAAAHREPIVPPYTPPPPAAPDLPEGALVILPGDPRYESLNVDASGALQQHELRQWGAKDNLKAMTRAARQHNQSKGKKTPISTDDPGPRKRVGGSKK